MKTGLVLSGGGARAFMHIGVLSALDERGIKVDHIAATSAGAVVGAMYASGISPKEILEILRRPQLFRSVRFAFGGNGLLRLSKVEQFLQVYLPENNFSALNLSMTITATDIATGEIVAYHSGEILKPMLASCGIPGLFEPYFYDGRQLVDGGVLNNVPVEFVKETTDRVIGSHCNSYSLSRPLRSSFEVAYRALLLAVHHQNTARLQKCDVVIDPPQMAAFSIFDFSKAREMYEVGYGATLLALDRSATFIREADSPNIQC